jgi:DNA-binding CsgD family transcriptional regulator
MDRKAAIADITGNLLGAEVGELTRGELLVMAPEQDVLDRFLPPDVIARLLGTRREVRILYGRDERTGSGRLPALAVDGVALASTGELPHFAMIRDRAVVYLPLRERHPVADQVTRLRNGVIAELLATFFEVMWTQAIRLRREAGGEGWHDEVLKVLSDGLTDDRAAMRLHMSKRTFARRVAALMEHLDARSRFQAGVYAARRGLV